MVVEFQPEAEDKLKEIHAYYQRKSQSAADKILRDIYKAVQPLTSFPQMASIEPLLSDAPGTFRSLVVRTIFKIIYVIDEENETINIVTVWDCRQDANKLKEEVV